MTKDSKLVRLRLETIARLEEFRARLEQRDERGSGPMLESGSPGGGPASLDSIINQLLDEPIRHRQRRKLQTETARAAREAARAEAKTE